MEHKRRRNNLYIGEAFYLDVVHSEGYSVEFLLNLLTYTIVQMESGNKLSLPGGVIRKDSDVDKLYQLLRLMTVRYFNSASEI